MAAAPAAHSQPTPLRTAAQQQQQLTPSCLRVGMNPQQTTWGTQTTLRQRMVLAAFGTVVRRAAVQVVGAATAPHGVQANLLYSSSSTSSRGWVGCKASKVVGTGMQVDLGKAVGEDRQEGLAHGMSNSAACMIPGR